MINAEPFAYRQISKDFGGINFFSFPRRRAHRYKSKIVKSRVGRVKRNPPFFAVRWVERSLYPTKKPFKIKYLNNNDEHRRVGTRNKVLQTKVFLTMQKVSVFLPDELVVKMKILIPQQQYSPLFIQLLERELQIREAALYQSACEVEADETLNQEMSDWDVTLADGIKHESW